MHQLVQRDSPRILNIPATHKSQVSLSFMHLVGRLGECGATAPLGVSLNSKACRTAKLT
jgi:hypothetical protein